MTAYTVLKILAVEQRSLLLITTQGQLDYSISVYDEHTGQTLVRQCAPTLENFRLALRVLESGVSEDF